MTGVPFYYSCRPEGLQLYYEGTSHWCFSVKVSKFLKTPFFYRTPQVATFETKNIHTSAVDLLGIRIGNLDWNESHDLLISLFK